MPKLESVFKPNGPLVSSKDFSDPDRADIEVQFHHREKAECMLTVASSWYGGDFFEFGSHDLNTFRDMLTAYNICGMTRAYPDVRFYAFDIFGKLDEAVDSDLTAYFKPYSDQGDRLAHHEQLVRDHGLYTDHCYLVQGLFKNTLTPELKAKWRASQHPTIDDSCRAKMLHLPEEHRTPKTREIGFASIDCNLGVNYKTVFEWIFDMMAPNSYVYLDEGLQNPDVIAQWKQFVTWLGIKRDMNAVYVRNAGGFGSLWRLYPISNSCPLAL